MNVDVAPAGRNLMSAFNIGNTPLIRLPDIAARGAVWLKAEYTNPFGSVKDRTAAYLLAWAGAEVGDCVRVVESTSGNLGIALARLGRQLKVPVTLVMDASLPSRRIADVRRTGAAVRVVERCLPGMTFRESRIALAKELGSQTDWLWLNQYDNEQGMYAHEQTTGPEIWKVMNGAVDAVVASVGTGGTLCGISAALRGYSRAPLIVGVEPVGSTISGGEEGDYLPAGSGMRGMGEIVARHRDLVDLFAKVPDGIAAAWTQHLLHRFGLEVGATTGAAVSVAAMLAAEYDEQVVVIAPDRGRSFHPALRALATSGFQVGDTSQIQIAPFGMSQ
ncbi:PLP-dependent cysteine synthase family protein [Nocardia sp. NPDC050175]|uniref:PLP-dependent cysteine synthase family protein n=1 Tax=Nocardia sp. NPDC050175 TaxID=3364317 RepID=UPI0037A2D3F0